MQAEDALLGVRKAVVADLDHSGTHLRIRETRPFDHGKLEVVTLSGVVFGKATFQPGWRWSRSAKPIAGTDSCQVHHNGDVVSGRMHVVMDDVSEGEAGPGDVVVIPPGHDAWTVGDQPCVVFDFSSQIAPVRQAVGRRCCRGLGQARSRDAADLVGWRFPPSAAT